MQPPNQIDNYKFNGRSIRINTKKVDIQSVDHHVEGVQWARVYDFSNSTSSDKHFIILPEEDGTFQIIYGLGLYGQRPIVGASTTTTYRVGAGSEGNQPTGVITQLSTSPSARQVATITQASAFTNGFDPESIEDLRQHASLYFRTQSSIKGVKDCIEVLEQQPEINKVQAVIF